MIHITDALYTFNGRILQRCARCGEKLIDSAQFIVKQKGEDQGLWYWKVGTYVLIDDNDLWQVISDTSLRPVQTEGLCVPWDLP